MPEYLPKPAIGVLYALSLSTLLLLLTACEGEGGGTSAADSAPTAPLSFSLSPRATRTFGFSWADGINETEYRLLENPDGLSGFTRTTSFPADDTGFDQAVFLPSRINASYILQACNAAGCSESSTVFVSGNLAEAVGYVKASNGAGDEFGSALAMDGDTWWSEPLKRTAAPAA